MNKLVVSWVLLLSSLLLSTNLLAALKMKYIDYSYSGGPSMQGYLVYDDSITTPQPGILLVHDWMGLNNFIKEKAQQLAKQGYVTFAADIYGKNVRPKNKKEAGQFAGKYKNDRSVLRQHIVAAYDMLKQMKQVDPTKIVVMGYCFGGMTALELARTGVPLAGTVSFHGNLSTPDPDDAKKIKGFVLVLHGNDDPNVPPAEVAAFKKEMNQANVKMTFIGYEGAVHAFTNPAAGNDNSKGSAYNAEADRNSWKEFQAFLKSTFNQN